MTAIQKSINYGQNSGGLYAVAYGRILLIDGYVEASNSGYNYLLATINDVDVIHYTQTIIQTGENPTEPYCTFGNLSAEGQMTITKSEKGTIYRINCAAIIK